MHIKIRRFVQRAVVSDIGCDAVTHACRCVGPRREYEETVPLPTGCAAVPRKGGVYSINITDSVVFFLLCLGVVLRATQIWLSESEDCVWSQWQL